MDIKSVNTGSLYAFKDNSDKRVKQEQDEVRKSSLKADKLELSGKKDLSLISDKIEAGVYNDPEVLRQVALRLSREFSPDELADWTA